MFLASIHDTPFHAVAYDVKEVLLRKRTIHRQEHTWCSLLYQQTGFDQAAVRIAPTACTGEPMQQDHGHQFRRDLTEDTHALLAAPTIHLAVLFPYLPDQFDVPTNPQQDARLHRTEP